MRTLSVFLTLTSFALSYTSAQTSNSSPSFAFLGPVGTYSDQAATKVAQNKRWNPVAASTITEVSEMVSAGKTPYGLIPFENSTGGYVKETRKIFGKIPRWRVIGFVDIPIDNTLLVNPGTKLNDITTLISHPQPFIQSDSFLKEKFPNAKRIEVKSTAKAAEKVAQDGGKTMAAIASPAAAQVYKLTALAQRIQDNKTNATRFLIVQHAPLETNKLVQNAVISLTPKTNDKGIALERLLKNVREQGWRTTSILSSPRGALGEQQLTLFLTGVSTPVSQLSQLFSKSIGKVELIGGY